MARSAVLIRFLQMSWTSSLCAKVLMSGVSLLCYAFSNSFPFTVRFGKLRLFLFKLVVSSRDSFGMDLNT
jgi:hypothetical protein